MTAIQTKYSEVQDEVERILGNVKGGFIQPAKGAEMIHLIYAQFIHTQIRYPSEPPIYVQQETQEDRIMKQHFSQADKGK